MENTEKLLKQPFYGRKNILIIGAGNAGKLVLKEIKKNNNHNLLGFVDDNSKLISKTIENIRIYGPISNLPRILTEFNKKRKEINEVIIAIPSAEGKIVRKIIRLISKEVPSILILPTNYESPESIKTGIVTPSLIRSVNAEDFFRRKPILPSFEEIFSHYSGKTILITGAGGSIGSEIAKQVGSFSPKNLILLENSEPSLYTLEKKLSSLKIKKKFLLCDIRDCKRLSQIIKEFNPEVIFHAAAYKHVPLMEENPRESILNNIKGFCNLLKVIDEKVQELVLISSDKAVNPSSIMGISKRICELILQAKSKKINTKLLAVRFGNVAGSSGSVIPLFNSQIEAGGPVTVTDKKMKRFFMTIPEAAQLVLQTPILGNKGDILVLDMGEQCSLLELAEDMILLKGFIPNEEIQIKITGIRKGEKLEEELFNKKESTLTTKNSRIFIVKTNHISEKKLNFFLSKLFSLSKISNAENLNLLIRKEFEKFNTF